MSDTKTNQGYSLLFTIRNARARIAAGIGLLFLALDVSGQPERIPAETQDRLGALYKLAAENMKVCSPLFATAANASVPSLRSKVIRQAGKPKMFGIHGDLLLEVWADSLRFVGVVNKALFQKLQEATTQQSVPTIELGAAVERARGYCEAFKVQVPSDFKLTDVQFNTSEKSCWKVRWRRFVGQYVWDDHEESESVVVVFHEKDGLLTLGNDSCQPAPKSVDVKLSSEQAINKASKYVSLLQRSPFYLRARQGGFVATAVKACELRVAVPNWLLDPNRAALHRDGPPVETRLCWIVRFETIDAIEQRRNLKNSDGKPITFLAPAISIYLDAATGEVVGARFT